ncbi:MAG: hypothetical protein WDN48_04945 [Pseudolabrys sp.]
MTLDQFLFALTGPALIMVFALVMVIVTRWQDAREDRRRAAKDAATQRS